MKKIPIFKGIFSILLTLAVLCAMLVVAVPVAAAATTSVIVNIGGSSATINASDFSGLTGYTTTLQGGYNSYFYTATGVPIYSLLQQINGVTLSNLDQNYSVVIQDNSTPNPFQVLVGPTNGDGINGITVAGNNNLIIASSWLRGSTIGGETLQPSSSFLRDVDPYFSGGNPTTSPITPSSAGSYYNQNIANIYLAYTVSVATAPTSGEIVPVGFSWTPTGSGMPVIWNFASGGVGGWGVMPVPYTASQAFAITPFSPSYYVASVTVDGTPLSPATIAADTTGGVTTYTFNSVTTNHTLAATFALKTATATPVITTNPIYSGATSVSGTSEDNAAISLTVNGGSPYTTTATAGGTWTVTGLTLATGNTISVTALGTGETISSAATATVVAAPKVITAFNFTSPAATGVVTDSTHTIAVTVPYGTIVTALVPTITINGASVSPLSGVANNFSSPVTYTVTAADNTTQAYTVTVTVSSLSTSSSGNVTLTGAIQPYILLSLGLVSGWGAGAGSPNLAIGTNHADGSMTITSNETWLVTVKAQSPSTGYMSNSTFQLGNALVITCPIGGSNPVTLSGADKSLFSGGPADQPSNNLGESLGLDFSQLVTYQDHASGSVPYQIVVVFTAQPTGY